MGPYWEKLCPRSEYRPLRYGRHVSDAKNSNFEDSYFLAFSVNSRRIKHNEKKREKMGCGKTNLDVRGIIFLYCTLKNVLENPLMYISTS